MVEEVKKTKAMLLEEAKAKGIKYRTVMSGTELIRALAMDHSSPKYKALVTLAKKRLVNSKDKKI